MWLSFKLNWVILFFHWYHLQRFKYFDSFLQQYVFAADFYFSQTLKISIMWKKRHSHCLKTLINFYLKKIEYRLTPPSIFYPVCNLFKEVPRYSDLTIFKPKAVYTTAEAVWPDGFLVFNICTFTTMKNCPNCGENLPNTK